MGSALGDPLERGPSEEEALLPGLPEADDGLGLVALADDVEDHTLAELLVGDVVADVEAELLGAAAAGRGRRPAAAARRDSGRDHRVAVGAEAAPRAAAPAARLALRLDQLLRDLGEEAARRVVVGRAEQLPAPRVAEVEPLTRAGDADVAEAPLFLERVGVTERAHVREDPVLHPGEKDDRVLEALRGVQRHERDERLLA